MSLPGSNGYIFGFNYAGSPAGVDTSIINAPLGAIVNNTSTGGIPFFKTVALGTNTYDQAVALAATQTLTNKTLTSPTINSPTITDPTITGVGASVTKFCTTQVDKTNDTLVDITGLTAFSLTAAGIYKYEIVILGTSTANGGMKLALTLTTATLTSISYQALALAAASSATTQGTTATSPVPLFGVTAVANIGLQITGRLIVNAAGTAAVQFAQNATHVDTSSVYVGSWATLTRIG